MASKGLTMSLSLSIIIPAYNVEEWIGECLDSFSALKRDDFEVIVVNDGSTDKTKEMVERYRNSFKYLTCIDQENQGLSQARNNGFKIAKGDYIFFCDSDDYVDPLEFEDFINKALELKIDVIIGNGKDLFGSELKGSIKKDVIISKLGVVSGPDFYNISNKVNEFITPVWVRLYKTSFLKENRLLFFPKIIHEDEEFSPKVFSLAKSVAYLNNHFYIRRYRVGSITKNERHKYFNSKSCPSFIKIIEEFSSYIHDKKFNDDQRKVITHAVYKCYIEILRRELYFTREKLTDLKISSIQKDEVLKNLRSIKFDLKQKLHVFRLQYKILINKYFTFKRII